MRIVEVTISNASRPAIYYLKVLDNPFYFDDDSLDYAISEFIEEMGGESWRRHTWKIYDGPTATIDIFPWNLNEHI